jgi:hypothetical protein
MSTSPSSNILVDFLYGSFNGDPAEARAFCERVLSPNFIRFYAGGDKTDFERAVEKVTYFRANADLTLSLKFFVQDGNKVSGRLIGDTRIGDEPTKTMELMLMAELDDQGRFLKVWELASEYTAGEE